MDVDSLSQFWHGVLGGERVVRNVGWATIGAPGGMVVAFQGVAEAKVGKNRVHLDVEVGHIAVAAAQVVELGGAIVGPVIVDEAGAFQVCLDPEGNEWCLVSETPTD